MLAQILQVSRLPNQPINLQIHPQLPLTRRRRRPRPHNPRTAILLLGRKIRPCQLLLHPRQHLYSPCVLHLLRFLLLGLGGWKGAAAVAGAVHIRTARLGNGAVCGGGGDAAGRAGARAAGLDAGDEAVAAFGLEGWFWGGFAVEAPGEEGIVDELRVSGLAFLL